MQHEHLQFFDVSFVEELEGLLGVEGDDGLLGVDDDEELGGGESLAL